MGKKKIHKRKNVSSTYKNGSIVVTRDEHLDKTAYHSPGHSNPKDFYRLTLIIDSNRNDELVLVPLTNHNGKSSKGTTSDYIYIFDNFGNSIKLPSSKFKFRKGKSLTDLEINLIKKRLFNTGINALRNRYLVHKHIKKRK